MKKNIIYLTIFALIFLVFKNYTLVLSSTIDACYIWLYKVFPYLFIMIILQDLLIGSNISKFFKNTSIYIFFASLISGTPTSAYITGKLTNNNTISKNTGNVALIFTYFGNPLFLYTILNFIFASQKTTIKLMIITYTSNIILYLIYKKKLENSKPISEHTNINIASSIKSSINTTIMVLGAICFYLILTNILIKTFAIPEYLSIILKGTLEVTGGLNALANAYIPGKEILAVFFITFGGLSIHTQVKCILDEYNLDYKYFLKGRIYGTIIAIILTCIT